MKKLTSLTSLGISIGLLSINALFAQDNVITLNQLTEGETHNFNIGSYAENEEESYLQGDLAPQMQINPDEITTELESLEKCFNDLGVNDAETTAAQQEVIDAKIAINTGIAEKDNAVQAATMEIEEHNKHNENMFSVIGGVITGVKKTTTEETAKAKLKDLEKLKEEWDDRAVKWRVAAKNNKKENAEKATQLAKLARVCEIVSEEAYQSERIWNALKEKKEANNTTKREECITLLRNSIDFTKKSSFERSDELLKQADKAWEKIKQVSIGKQIAQAADKTTSVMQYVSIFGIISPAVISQSISLIANDMDDQEVAAIVANRLEEFAKKYYAKMARIEAGGSVYEVSKNSISSSKNALNTLKESKKSVHQKNPEAIDREIERAEVRLQAHEEALEVFWPTATPIQTGEVVSSSSFDASASKSSSSSPSNSNLVPNQNISGITTQVVNQNSKPINTFEQGVIVVENKLNQGNVRTQHVGEKLVESSEEQREFIQKVKDYKNKTEQNGAELNAVLDDMGW